VQQYDLGNFHKGIFKRFVNENYSEEMDYRAYIQLDDIILSSRTNSSKNPVMNETLTKGNIVNNTRLHIQDTIKSSNYIISHPLFPFQIQPDLKDGESVFVFFIDDDIKKCFYIPVTNDIYENSEIRIRYGKCVIRISPDRILLMREKTKDESDNPNITISDRGIELVGNVYINGSLTYSNNNY